MKLSRALGLLVVVALAGCSSPEQLVGPQGANRPTERIGSEDMRTAVVASGAAEVVAAHARALSAKDRLAVGDLLAGDFRYCVRASDVGDFPWMDGSCWSRTEELRMIGHMADPGYIGNEAPVKTIEAFYQITSVTRSGKTTTVSVDALITVLVSPDTGWLTSPRFEFDVVEGSHGIERIREIRELDVLREEASWAAIKNLYRL